MSNDINIVVQKTFTHNGAEYEYEEDSSGTIWVNVTPMCVLHKVDLNEYLNSKKAMEFAVAFLKKFTKTEKSVLDKIREKRHLEEFRLIKTVAPKVVGKDSWSTWAVRKFALRIAQHCSEELVFACNEALDSYEQERFIRSQKTSNTRLIESDNPIDAITRALTKMLESYTLANKRAKIAAKASSKMIRGAKRSLVGMKEISDSVSSGGTEVKMLSDEKPKEIQVAQEPIDTIALAETPAIPKITEPEPDAPTSGTDTFGNILTQTHPGERQQLLDRVDGIIRKQGRAITMNVITNIFKLYGILTADDKGPTRKAIDKKIMFIDTRYNKGVRFEVYCICENYVDYFVKALVAYTEPGYRGPGFLMEVGFTKEIQDEMYQLEVEKTQRQQSKQMRLDL